MDHTTADTREVVATDPVPVGLSGAACTAHGGKIDLYGGVASGGIYVDTSDIFDPATAAGSRWSSGAAAPITGGYGDAISAGGYVFYAGMRNATADFASVYSHDPAANSWTTMPSLTTARGAVSSVWHLSC